MAKSTKSPKPPKPVKASRSTPKGTPAAAAPGSPQTAAKRVKPLQTHTPPSSPYGLRELVWVRSADLDANPLNWRRHPPRQVQALKTSLKENGWAGILLWNDQTGRLVDGHARQGLDPDAIVPVGIGSWSEEQEKRILASLDPISAMAETDTAALRRLTEMVSTDLEALDTLDAESKEEYKKLTHDLEASAEEIEFGAPSSFFPEADEDDLEFADGEIKSSGDGDDDESPLTKGSPYKTPGETEGIFALKVREEITLADWGAGEPFDIPPLRSDMLASCPLPINSWLPAEHKMTSEYTLYLWGAGTIGIDWSHTVVGFYTDDRRFESCWNSEDDFASRLIRMKPYAVIAPEFSVADNSSRAESIYHTFRQRWVARYWQEAGLMVIPDVNFGGLYGNDWTWRLQGIPKNAPCISHNLMSRGDYDLDTFLGRHKNRLLSMLKILTPQQLLLYEGAAIEDEWYEDIQAHYPDMQIIRVRSQMLRLGDIRKEEREVLKKEHPNSAIPKAPKKPPKKKVKTDK